MLTKQHKKEGGKEMRRLLSLCTVVVALIVLMGIPANSAPKLSGTILAYAGHQEEWAKLTVEEFEKLNPGAKVEFIRLSGGEALARIDAEKGRLQASVWWGGPADTFMAAKGQGLLEKYVSPEAAQIDGMFKDPDGFWTGFYVGILGFTLNDREFNRLGYTKPTSWNELLDPKFKDLIVMANPGTSGTAYTVLATLVQLMGEDEAFAYLKQLHKNVQQYPTSGSAAGRMAGLGEVAVGIDFGHAVPQLAKQGYPVSGSYPKEGTGYEIGAVALLKDAPNPELGKAFIDFVLSKYGQELGEKAGAYQLLTNKTALSPSVAIPLSQAKLLNYDFEWAGRNRARLVERWNSEVFSSKK